MLNFLALFLKIWSAFLPLSPLKLLGEHIYLKRKKNYFFKIDFIFKLCEFLCALIFMFKLSVF